MLPGDPVFWAIGTSVSGVLLAVILGVLVMLPQARKLEIALDLLVVLFLAGGLFWASALNALTEAQKSCLSETTQRVSLCPDYGYTDATEITILAVTMWLACALIGVFIGLAVRIMLREYQVTRVKV